MVKTLCLTVLSLIALLAIGSGCGNRAASTAPAAAPPVSASGETAQQSQLWAQRAAAMKSAQGH